MAKKTGTQLDREIAEALYRGPAWRAEAPSQPSRLSSASHQRAVDKLLERMKPLEEKHLDAREELRLAGRESDGVYDDETHGHPVTPARKAAAERRWSTAVRAEQALTNKMRKIVLKIRAIDPTRVPWGWKNTR
jgi:uncharacterized iron-regulated membrane protein